MNHCGKGLGEMVKVGCRAAALNLEVKEGCMAEQRLEKTVPGRMLKVEQS